MIKVNEQTVPYQEGTRIKDLVETHKAGADIFIINGFPASPDTLLADGDTCCLIRRGEVPTAGEMESLLVARHTPGLHEVVKKAVVGIMGLGGLGTVVAGALARIGIGKLILADFDVVEPSNLNRQQYTISQLGMKKTNALKENLLQMNPYVAIETFDELLSEESIPEVFDTVDVLAECFDDPAMKAAALSSVLTNMPGIGYVGASGVAGYGDNNSIKTQKIRKNIYIIGDNVSAAEPGQGLMAPRVGIAAHHQANQILRILLEED
ncbi:MAG: sulfur carrier protein ThiS adenylyltransferase ThiF [Deltaproteobacteria bacterium]|jgi:sulfur carrier protein ThiS adenylyltransferase|nr:sulfur carrier protein ThiS adenylyltransferase ThiF [Deltaproteobacteria bacterium]